VADARVDSVVPDNLNAAREAANVLISSGHREIAIVAGPTYTAAAWPI
jgi:DNA-binding LacI/PurR family transcriptional regulator